MSSDELTSAERELLQRRARALAAPVAEQTEETLWIAEFPIGGAPHGLPLASLRAVLPLKAVTPVPLSDPHVLGVLRFEGQVISALSLSALLGGRGWRVDPEVLLIVDPGWGVLVALDSEQIPKATAVSAAAADRARGRSGDALAELELGGGRKVRLIDPRLLLDRRAGDRHAH